MNHYKAYLPLLLTVGSLLFSSCDSYLDKQPEDLLTIDQVFARRQENQRYLASVYNFLPVPLDPYNNVSPVSDEADFIWNGVGANNINLGDWSPTYIPYDRYAALYQGIRSASIYVKRGAECKECDAQNPGITTRYVAEARALRAWYYALLMRQYGPVAILEEPKAVDAEVSDLQIPRHSYDECVAYLVNELDEAASQLPIQHSAADYGRVDKRVALAMKARILLYAASPLWNGNTDYSGFTNKDGKALVNTTYEVTKWQKAAAAAKDVIDLMPVGLYKKMNNGAFDPKLSYQYLSIDRWNPEIIFARNVNANNWEHHAAPRQVTAWNGMGVTQEMVDAYHMENGKQITEAGSGYQEEGFSTEDTEYTKAGTWQMWTHREPRFYASVTYNGAQWLWAGDNGTNPIRVELYNTGRSGLAGSHDHTNTGYLLHRFVNPSSNVANWVGSPQHDIYIRLAEMYLNYAEALNEAEPGHSDILRYVNLVRERAGIPGLPEGLSQNEMREKIRHERRIELAFEQHRAFDTRRWKIAEQTDGGPKHGMNVGGGSSLTDPAFYQRRVFENRVFQRKHYLWPIPQSEMDRNKAWVQNPGW